MRLRTTSVEQFRRSPEGAAVIGNGWVYYCVDRELCGYAAWGVPGVADFQALVPCLDVALEKSAPAHVSIVDLRRLGPLGGEVFAELARYGEDRRSLSARKVLRQVILPPPGYSRAVIAGFRELLRPPYELEFVDSPEQAAKAADRADAQELLGELARLIDAPIAAQVARMLADADVNIETIARRLGIAPRTLQRRIAAEGTSFAQIARETMVERAKALLASSDDKLEVIARKVGCPSASHFTASFRRVTGETPSAWRARNTRG